MGTSIEVWGDYALFSRPEFKAERMSYDVMTPSAARGIVEAIFWHPGMRYVIDRIHVCQPIKFTNVMKNERPDVIQKNNIRRAMLHNDCSNLRCQDGIVQRHNTLLKDVRYVIDLHFDITEDAFPSATPEKFINMLERRLEKGQCFKQPYFGIREYPAHFAPCTKQPVCPPELKGEIDLGMMLLDLEYSGPGNIQPVFFHAVMKDGVLEIPNLRGKE